MSAPHETPLLIELPPQARAATAFSAILASENVRHVFYPPLWCMDRHGVDVPRALPHAKAIGPDTLEDVIERICLLCDESGLDALVTRRWKTVHATVRDYYLKRGFLASMGALLKVGKSTVDQTPPPAFRAESIHDASFSVAYRLRRHGETHDPTMPAEEGTLTLYPFDVNNCEARTEHDLPGSGALLEAFCYARGREQHRVALTRIAREHTGWRVVDPLARGEAG